MVKRGENMQLGEAYECFHGELQGYLRKAFGDDDIAEEAAQQAFSKAVFSLPDIPRMPESALRAWLYATARNAAIDMLRRRKRLQYDFDFDMLPTAQGTDVEGRDALREQLRTLDEKQRELVSLRYVQGYNATEIAAALNMTASNVRYHLMTALHQLRRQMQDMQ